MAVTNERTVAVFGGTGFLGRRVVRHLRASVGFLFGLHQGTRIGVLTCLLLMIRNFNRLKRISTMNNRSRVRLLALTVR
jgi:nucleoside-diphosphate-sugar epimerase